MKIFYQSIDKKTYKGIAGVTSEHKIFDNLVNTNFDNPYAYNVLCTEVTYLICNGMKAYMSAIKDATTRKIIAYEISDSLITDFKLNVVKQLNENLLNDETMIHGDKDFVIQVLNFQSY